MAALGEELRAARESRRLSINEVSEQIHIRSVYLQAIEEGNWSAGVATVYVRGFVRTYARFLGLNAEEAVARFNESSPAPEPKPQAPEPSIIAEPTPGSVWIWGAGILALLLVLFVGYNYYRLQKSTQAAILAEATSAPVATPVRARAESKPQASHEVKGAKNFLLRLQQRSWLRVVVDGRDALEGVFEPGSEHAFTGKLVTVRAGNAGGVDVVLDGKDIGPLGPVGEVVERTFRLPQH